MLLWFAAGSRSDVKLDRLPPPPPPLDRPATRLRPQAQAQRRLPPPPKPQTHHQAMPLHPPFPLRSLHPDRAWSGGLGEVRGGRRTARWRPTSRLRGHAPPTTPQRRPHPHPPRRSRRRRRRLGGLRTLPPVAQIASADAFNNFRIIALLFHRNQRS